MAKRHDPFAGARDGKAASMLRDGSIIGLLTFVFIAVYFFYLVNVGFPDRIARDIPHEMQKRFLLAQFFSVLIVCLASSTIGIFFSKRYGLPGMGTPHSVRASLPWIIGMAAIGAPAAFFLFDRPYQAVAPGYYPLTLKWAFASIYASAFSSEIIGRFGMMTIFMGIVRRFWAANLMQALFVTLVEMRGFYLADQTVGWNYLTVTGVSLSIVGSLAAGWVFHRFGILSALAGHILFEMRCLLFLL